MNWIIVSLFLITGTAYATQCIDCTLSGYGGATPDIQDYPKMPDVQNYDDALMALQFDPNFPKFPIAVDNYDSPWSEKNNEDSSNLVNDYDEGIKKILKYIPDSSLKNGLKKYLEIINAKNYKTDDDVGASNAGISAYNQNTLDSNPCFAKLVEAFYTDIFERESLKKNYFASVPTREELYGRPSLSTEAGKGKNRDLKPGWLFEKALEYSGGDPNLALNLIAVCGHDDNGQGILSYKLEVQSKSTPSKKDLLSVLDHQIEVNRYYLESQDTNYKLYKKNPEEYKKTFPYVSADFSPYPKDYNYSEALEPPRKHLQDLIKFRQKISDGAIKPNLNKFRQRTIRCPDQNSSFFLSKSLGNNIDLSEKDKNRIAAIQAPNMGRSVLPSKNYHIMGSAFMACQLISTGISPQMAVIIQKIAGWAYRTVRINAVLKKDLADLEKLEEKYNEYLKEFKKENTTKIKTSRGRRSTLTSAPMSMEEWVLAKKNKGNIERELKFIMDYPILTEDASLKDLITKLKAAREFSKMTLGGNFLGKEVPFTNISLNFINDPVTKHIKGINRKNNRRQTQRETSSDNAAREKALTYLIDWSWTTKQHEIGATFASQKCKKKPLNFRPDDQLCDTLNDGPGITCKINFEEDYPPILTTSGKNNTNIDFHDDDPIAPVSALSKSLEAVSEEMEKKYLTPNLKEEKGSDDTIIFSGLY